MTASPGPFWILLERSQPFGSYFTAEGSGKTLGPANDEVATRSQLPDGREVDPGVLLAGADAPVEQDEGQPREVYFRGRVELHELRRVGARLVHVQLAHDEAEGSGNPYLVRGG